jgi:RNA polymerase sigma factor (sigma-70 family)
MVKRMEPIQRQNTEKTRQFSILIEPYRSALQAYCRSIAATTWDADDLVQETWLKAYKMFLRESTRNDMSKTYLFRIAPNTWIDHCRKKRHAVETLTADNEYPSETSEQVELRSAMGTLITNLPARQIVLLMLIDGFGYTALETAQLLQSTEGAVKAGLHRARAKLRALNGNADRTTQEYLVSKERKVDEHIVYTYLQAFQQHNPYALVRLLNDVGRLDIAPVIVGSTSSKKHTVESAERFRTKSTLSRLMAA